MRLRKKIYVIHEEKTIVDYNELGRPIYDIVKTYHPIRCEVEPFSNKLAETTYGVFVDATNRVFSNPSELLQLKEPVKYGDKLYKITEIIRYDKHYETLLKYVGDADE